MIQFSERHNTIEELKECLCPCVTIEEDILMFQKNNIKKRKWKINIFIFIVKYFIQSSTTYNLLFIWTVCLRNIQLNNNLSIVWSNCLIESNSKIFAWNPLILHSNTCIKKFCDSHIFFHILHSNEIWI